MDNTDTKRRALLMYISKVSGHRQATAALQRALRQIDSSMEAPALNGFGYTFPILEKVVNQMYMSVIRRKPEIWERAYDNPRFARRTSWIKEMLYRISRPKMARLMKEFQPDTVVCTQAFPCGMMADYKIKYNLPLTVIGVLTDFAAHSYWIHPGVDYYIVPCDECRREFLEKGVPPEQIKVYGIPIRAKFAQHPDREQVADSMGLDLKVPTILIMGGGQGLGPIQEVVRHLEELPEPLQMIVTTGTNQNLLQWLDTRPAIPGKKIVTFEYASNVDELMSLAQLIVTKPGGLTTSECLAKGLPMVLVNPLPGQEMRNAQFLLKKGIAIKVDDVSLIGQEIAAILRSPERLTAMRLAALDEGRPYAARDIARLILPQPVEVSADQLILNDV